MKINETKKPAAGLADLSGYDLSSPAGLSEALMEMADNKKGRDITRIDLTRRQAPCDYFVIATVTSSTAVKALYEYIDASLENAGIFRLHLDADSKWIAIDYGSVIAHIMTAETREFYDIERLWADGGNLKSFTEK